MASAMHEGFLRGAGSILMSEFNLSQDKAGISIAYSIRALQSFSNSLDHAEKLSRQETHGSFRLFRAKGKIRRRSAAYDDAGKVVMWIRSVVEQSKTWHAHVNAQNSSVYFAAVLSQEELQTHRSNVPAWSPSGITQLNLSAILPPQAEDDASDVQGYTRSQR